MTYVYIGFGLWVALNLGVVWTLARRKREDYSDNFYQGE